MAILTKPEKSKYKHVYVVRAQGKWYYQSSIFVDGKHTTRNFDNEHDAGKCVDMNLIARGLQPVNVLKPKK
jgi:hypothetical protein